MSKKESQKQAEIYGKSAQMKGLDVEDVKAYALLSIAYSLIALNKNGKAEK